MPFSFFSPWLLLGALALGIPIWLHLRRRKETNLLQFSAVRFLEDHPEPRRGPLRLRDVLLFALRALALLALVGAFAWPYLRAMNTAPVKESRVYILDNTLSHQAQDGFAQDRSRILSDLNGSGSDVQVAVIELTSVPHIVTSFGDDRATARRKLEQLKPSFERGSYLAAFRQASTLLGNSLGDRKRIVFLGDNQENQWKENISTPPFLRDVEVELPKAPARSLPNLSLSEPRVQRIFLGEKSLVHFTMRLTHVGEAQTADVTVRANGQVILNRTVELDGQPETILLQAQWEAEPSTWLRGEATVQGAPDSLAADNRVFFSLAPVVEGKVALLAQSRYLRLALSPEIMRGQWATRAIEPTALAQELTAGEDADVLCMESSYLQSADARKLLWHYVSSGRGALLLVDRVTPVVKEALRELGFEAESNANLDRRAPEKFQFVLSNHPIFHPFISPDYGNLLEVKVWRYARLKPLEAMPLVFSDSGAGLFFQSTKFPGKLFVAAFGMDRTQTSWPIHQTFIPFMDLALQAARAEDPMPVDFEPGEVAMIQLPASMAARELVLHDGQTEVARERVELGRVQVHLPVKPGLYTVSCDERTQVEKIFCVNPSPKESQLVYEDAPEAVKAWQLNRPNEPVKTPAQVASTRLRLAAILQQRLWWWMLLGALAALMLETLLAAARKGRVKS